MAGQPSVKMDNIDLFEASCINITYASGYGFRKIQLEYC